MKKMNKVMNEMERLINDLGFMGCMVMAGMVTMVSVGLMFSPVIGMIMGGIVIGIGSIVEI